MKTIDLFRIIIIHLIDNRGEVPLTMPQTQEEITENGIRYLVIGKLRIRITEHFAESGKDMSSIIEDVIKYDEKTKSSQN